MLPPYGSSFPRFKALRPAGFCNGENGTAGWKSAGTVPPPIRPDRGCFFSRPGALEPAAKHNCKALADL